MLVGEGDNDPPAVDKQEKKKKKKEKKRIEVQAEGEDVTMDQRELHNKRRHPNRLRFRLAPAALPGSAQPAHRVEKGAVTEAMVAEAAKAGARLVLGRRAVLTPLARDRARAAGVEIDRER